MDLLQEQIAILNIKVDALHQVVEGLSSQTTEVLSELRLASGDKKYSLSGINSSQYTHSYRGVEGEMEHKDVLSDFIYPDSESQTGERNLTPEVQIQRLTAQLTAAYNRIAALEEQLLSKRIH
ncbi:MAG: hypothetical protein Kow00121_08050 [Elainellaceae cyanobacterium]